MRDLINICEAANYHVNCFWYNPQTNEAIDTMDHSEEVARRPALFGISSDDAEMMNLAFHETTGQRFKTFNGKIKSARLPTGITDDMDHNDAWEALAIQRGWIRGSGRDGGILPFLNGTSAEGMWYAAQYMTTRGFIADALSLELDPGNHFVTLYEEKLARWLKAGPKRAVDVFKM